MALTAQSELPKLDLSERRRSRLQRRAYAVLLWGGVVVFVAALVAIIEGIVSGSTQAIGKFGLGFIWGTTFDPVHNVFGAGVFIMGTLLTTALALVVAVPIGLATASFLCDICPKRLAAPVGVAIDLIAAVPSIVVGLWGAFVLVPVFARDVEPFLQKIPVIKSAFSGANLGQGILLAGMVLAIMIVPTMVALSRTALLGVPSTDREAAYALGATQWQVIRNIVIPEARSGILAAVTLSAGRAVGETIAVAFLIGNSYKFSSPFSLSAPLATLGTAIINNFGESSPGTLIRSVVMALGLVLLIMTLAINIGGRLLIRPRKSMR